MNNLNLPLFYTLTPTIQNYDWGSTLSNSFIRNFLKNLNNFDVNINKPIAELWMGAHKKSPSIIYPVEILESKNQVSFNKKEYIDKMISNYPKHILGENLFNKNISTLPFLFKILDIEKPLSIQAHPDKNLAKILHKRDPLNYPDDNHKPELAICIKDFEAMVGFRPPEEILNFIKIYQLNDFFYFINNLNKSEIIKEIYKYIITLDKEKIKIIANHIFSFLNSNNPDKVRDKWFYKLSEYYGLDDPGILFIYIFQYFKLNPGEAIFLGPNIPHAYLYGNILEIMADSDNVVRGGLTNKFKDIETLIDMLDYNNSDIKPLHSQYGDFYKFYNTPVKDFLLFILHEPQSSHRTISIKLLHFPSILLLLEGNLKISIKNNNKEIFFNKSEILFFPGDLKDRKIDIEIECSNNTWAYLATTLL